MVDLDTRWLYTGLVAMMVGERLIELAISHRNQRWLEAHGAIEVGTGHYRWMVLLHGLFPVSCLLEVWGLGRRFHLALGVVMLSALVMAMALRYWVMVTLGRRWTTRVFCLPGEPLVTSGPFRFFRHPNYMAVVIEFVALPMVHTAGLTAVVFSLANAFLLRRRIAAEEEGLAFHTGRNRGGTAVIGPESGVG